MGSEDESRVADYNEALKAMEAKDYDAAIDSFQKCMRKLSRQGLGLTSDLFPKCLQNIADCYNEKDDIEKALSFKKFEKLYYETVLLHNGGLDGLHMTNGQLDDLESQSSRDRGDGSSEASADSATANAEDGDKEDDLPQNETTKRATEYQQLARLCLQQECVSLALEYSGKATLLFRHHYGDDHEQTKKSFELFTSIYAEAGKKQYSDSMDQANIEPQNNTDLPAPASVEETLLRHRRNLKNDDSEENKETRPLKRTRSILKKKSLTDATSLHSAEQMPPETPRRVTFADPLPQMVRLREDGEHDDSSTNFLLFILVCLLIILVSLLVSAIVCQLYPKIGACVEFRREITYYYNRIRYFYQGYLRFK